MTVNINFIKREERNYSNYLLIGIGILLFILVVAGSFGYKVITDYQTNAIESEIQLNKVAETEAQNKQLMYQTQQMHEKRSKEIRESQFSMHEFYSDMLALVPSTIEYQELAYMKEDIWYVQLSFEEAEVLAQLMSQWEDKSYIESIEIMETMYGELNTVTLNLHVSHDGFIAEVSNEVE